MVRIGLFIVVSVAGAVSGHAQAIVSTTYVAEVRQDARMLQRDKVEITYIGKSVSLDDVLREIGRQAGLGLTVNRSAVDLSQRVSVDIKREPLSNALKMVLINSGIQARIAPDGRAIMLSPESPSAAIANIRQGVIIGKIIHAKTKQPITGATILLDNAATGVTTASDGTFRISVPAGTHTLHIRSVGFTRQSRSVIVGEEQLSVEITMDPSASVLDEVVVTGTVVATARKEISTPITVITAEEIEKRGITRIEQFFRGEVPGVLALEQGSEVYGDGLPGNAPNFGAAVSSKIFTRGASGFSSTDFDDRGNPTPLKTYVDGIEMLNPAYLGTIDPQSIERIEIIAGPQASTIYGAGAMGGVMQIFTKKGQGNTTPEFRLSLRQGFLQNSLSDGLTPKHNHALTMTGGSGSEFSYSGNLSFNYTGQWRPGLWNRSIGASVGIAHTRGRFTAQGSFSTTYGKNGSIGGGPGPSPVLQDNVATGEWMLPFFNSAYYMTRLVASSQGQTASIGTTFRQRKNIQHTLTVGKNQTYFGTTPNRPRFYLPQDTLWSSGISSGQRTTASYNIATTFNAQGRFSSTITAGANGSQGTQVNVSGNRATQTATQYLSDGGLRISQSVSDQSWGEFASLRIGVFQQLFFTLGLRAEQNPAYGKKVKVDWTPNNGLAYTMERGDLTVKLLGSYGRATKSPTLEMRLFKEETNATRIPSTYIVQYEAPDLTAEYSRGPQGGMEVYYGSLGSFTINRYYQMVTDLIQRVVVDTLVVKILSGTVEQNVLQRQYRNVGKIRQHGWEATGALKISYLNFRGTYSWNDSRIYTVNTSGDGAGGFYPGKMLQQAPSHMANLTVSYARGGSSISLANNYVGQALDAETFGLIHYMSEFNRIKTYTVGRKGRINVEVAKPGYFKSDISIMQRLTPWASATVNVINVGNNVTSDIAWYAPSLGRQTTVGLTVRSLRK